MSCGSRMPRGEQIAKPAERGTRLAGPFFLPRVMGWNSSRWTHQAVVSPVTQLDSAEILTSASTAAMASNLMWFATAIRTTLADAGQDGWGAAATASSAAVGGLFLVLLTVSAALAYSIAGSGNQTLTAGLNDFVWALVVLSSFPRAMLIMSGSFGLWRARLISNRLFGLGSRSSSSACWAAPRG